MKQLEPMVVTRLFSGHAVPYGPNGEPSAIRKQAITSAVMLTTMGLLGDEQGDQVRHGGPDKALHHYPEAHYSAWQRDLPKVDREQFSPGAFGENLTTDFLTEHNVCLGDVFRCGTALVQVSQARQPCWKLNIRFDVPNMAMLVQQTARTGWYYRVLEAGEVIPGATMQLLERPHGDWPIARLLHYLYNDPLNKIELQAITRLSTLAPSWQQLAEQRLETGCVEDWSQRLTIPEAVPDRSLMNQLGQGEEDEISATRN